jgi:hypothetical protein
MKPIHKVAMASAVALAAFASDAMGGAATQAEPIGSPRHYCLAYGWGGDDCSFTSYAQCQASASGINAECFAGAAPDEGSEIRAPRGYRSRAQSH